MFESGPYIWLLAICGGFVILGGIIAYGLMRSRAATPLEDAESEKATRNLYHKEEHSHKSH